MSREAAWGRGCQESWQEGPWILSLPSLVGPGHQVGTGIPCQGRCLRRLLGGQDVASPGTPVLALSACHTHVFRQQRYGFSFCPDLPMPCWHQMEASAFWHKDLGV